MSDAARICALLIKDGAVRRDSVPAIDHPDVRHEVEQRLSQVGLVLATSPYSDHVGLRLSPDVTADASFDAASNLNLRSGECALLVIAWARLALQKRTAQETRHVPGQQALLPDDRASAARSFTPQVRIAALAREFKRALGSASNVKRLVTRLRNLKFLGGRGGIVEPGPLLELALDGERLVTWIRRNVLAELLEEKAATDAAKEEADAAPGQVLHVLHELGGAAGMAKLREATGERVARLRAILKDLEAEGRVRREGLRSKTRYLLVT